MNIFLLRNLKPAWQYGFCLSLVAGICALLFLLSPHWGYQLVALLLLLLVSVLAMFFDILPVLAAAALSALVWNFFFIPPLFTFHIEKPEDALLFALYFFIASVNAVLTYQVRRAEKRARDKVEKEKSIALYRTLFNSLSHELRTPIANIIGAADTLKENETQLKDVQRKDLLDQISEAGFRLSRQVENLLNMSRLETGLLSPKPDWTDLEELIEDTRKKLDNPRNGDIVSDFPPDFPLCKLDAGLLEQMLKNLLENALNYTPVGTSVHVTCQLEGNRLSLKVKDAAPGIPEKQLDQIFDKFYRLPNTLPGGSGLGLSIVKGFSEAMGGTVKAANAPEGGAIFEVNIPVETTFINQLKNE